MRALLAVRPEPHRVLDDDGNAEPYREQLSVDDRVALEAAMEVATEVVAVGIGGEAARDCVRSALQRGADDGIHVAFEPIEAIAGEKYAAALARLTARESPDLLMVGETSSFGGSEIAGLAAARLEWPSATRVTEIGPDHPDLDEGVGADELALQRKLAVGRQEIVVVPTPAVLGVDSGFTQPKRAPMRTVLAGRRAGMDTVSLESVVPGESRFSMSVGNATVENVTPNQRWGRGRPPREGTVEQRIYRMLGRGGDGGRSAGERIDAEPEDAAERVVEFLQERELL